MKRLFTPLLLLMLSVVANAAIQIDGIYYNLNASNGTATLVAGTEKYSGNFKIPSTVSFDGMSYSVTTIGSDAFFQCTELISVSMPNSVKSIGITAFARCSHLTSITIPGSVTWIGSGAFAECTGLQDVYCEATVPPSASKAFAGITVYVVNPVGNVREELMLKDTSLSRLTLHVPASSVAQYQATAPWSGFGSIQALSATPTAYQYSGRTWMVGSLSPIRFDFATINDAMNSSMVSDGDILYLDHAMMQGQQTVSKKVKIVFNNTYYYDLGVFGDVNIEAADVTIDGLTVTGNINVRDERTRLEHCTVKGSILSGYNYECDDAVINSCDVSQAIDDSNGWNWTMTNNLINGSLTNATTGYSQAVPGVPGFSEFKVNETVESGATLTLQYIISYVNALKCVEYFWDQDPGWTKAIQLPLEVAVWNQPVSISTTGVSIGQHQLVVRAQSSQGYWVTRVASVNVTAQPVITDPKPVFSVLTVPTAGTNDDFKITFSVAADGGTIDWVEYFWDSDPGYQRGLTIAGQGYDNGAGITRTDYAIDCQGLTGSHTFYIRARCGSEWTQHYFKEVKLSAPAVVVEYIDANDLAALKLISDHLGLNGYWSFANEGRLESDFPGVTFLDHRVVAIDLQNSGLSGTLSQDWMPALSEITYLNLSRNNIQGDLTPFVYRMPKLKTIDMSHNRLSAVSGAIPASVASIDISSQYRVNDPAVHGANEGFVSAMNQETPVSVALSSATALSLPTLFYFDANRNDNSLRAGLQLVDMSNPATVYGAYTYDAATRAWTFTPQLGNDFTLENGQQVALVTTGQWQCWSAWPATVALLLGDANIDGRVDVLDVQHTLNYILATAQPFSFWAANTYTDQIINVQDIVCTVNILMGLPNDARQATLARSIERSDKTESGNVQCWVYCQDERVALATATDVAAIDVELVGVRRDEVSLLLPHRDFAMIGQNTATGSRFVIYSPTGAAIPAGKLTALLALEHSAEPVAVNCADMAARQVVTAVGQPTGISQTLRSVVGTKVTETRLAPGIYIVHTIGDNGESNTVKILKK